MFLVTAFFRMIVGQESPDAGTLTVGDDVVCADAPLGDVQLAESVIGSVPPAAAPKNPLK